MADKQIELIAHLARRAGFGATREELEEYAKIGYEGAVDKLLETSNPKWMSEYLIRRYHPDESSMLAGLSGAEAWLYRMITTDTPLLEKMTLFWHGIFATGYPKVLNAKPLSDQIRMFKRHAMGDFRKLLVEMARDPAMIIWLDNQQNHKDAINDLKIGNIHPVYFLKGNDQFLQTFFIQKVSETFFGDSDKDQTLMLPDDMKGKEIMDRLTMSDLFSSKKLFVLRK